MKHKYIVGLYDDDEVLVKAVKKIRKKGYRMHEVLTPFPVHGLDHAMGLQDTRLHTAGFVIGATGTMFALGCMTAISAVDWPVNVGGKPFFAFPSFVPITFELTVLFASIGMVAVMYIRNGFSIFKDKEVVDPRITDDRFAMVFCAKKYDKAEDQAAIRKIMKETGAVEIKEREMTEKLPDNLWKSEEDYKASLAAHH